MAMASPSSRSETSSHSYSSAFASSLSLSSAFASSSVVNFAPRASPLITRSSSDNSKLYGNCSSPSSPPSLSSSVRFSVEQRPASPGRRSMTVTKKQRNNNAVSSTTSKEKRSCMCSPTTHPGSFRCAYHKRLAEQEEQQKQQQLQEQQKRQQTASSSSGRKLNLRRSAMKNSLVRIGGVEGELVKRNLTALIRPSSHQLRRREAFQPRPSRLSVMSKAQDS